MTWPATVPGQYHPQASAKRWPELGCRCLNPWREDRGAWALGGRSPEVPPVPQALEVRGCQPPGGCRPRQVGSDSPWSRGKERLSPWGARMLFAVFTPRRYSQGKLKDILCSTYSKH